MLGPAPSCNRRQVVSGGVVTSGPHRTRQRCAGPVCDRPSASRPVKTASSGAGGGFGGLDGTERAGTRSDGRTRDRSGADGCGEHRVACWSVVQWSAALTASGSASEAAASRPGRANGEREQLWGIEVAWDDVGDRSFFPVCGQVRRSCRNVGGGGVIECVLSCEGRVFVWFLYVLA